MASGARPASGDGPLRILHVLSSDRFAGVEQFVRRLALRQAHDGHAVSVIGGAGDQMTAALAEADIAFTPAGSTRAALSAAFRALPRVDVVNTHMTAGDVAAVLARLASPGDPPIVATRHFASRRGSTGPGLVYRLVERAIDQEISVSRAVASEIRVPSTVIHPGVEVDSVPGPVPARRPVILIAQRLQPEKNTEVGLSAFAASGLAAEGWTLEVAGEGPELEPLRRRSAELGLADAVRFLGFRDDIADLMRRSSLLLAPAPFEHFGLTVLEAMSTGLAVVASDAGGHSEMLAGLDPRALFPPGDAERAAAGLRELAADEPARTALGAQELARQRAEFTLRSQAEKTERVYRKAISERSRS